MVEVGGPGKMCCAEELARFSVVAQILPHLSYGRLNGRSVHGRLGCVWQQGDVMVIKEIITYFTLVTGLWHQTSMVTLIFVDPISTLLLYDDTYIPTPMKGRSST